MSYKIKPAPSALTFRAVADAPTAKVFFELAPENGWPPAGTESVWAHEAGPNRYVLDNIPWFANGYAAGDTVRTEPGENGEPIVVEQVEWAGHYTVRVIPTEEGPNAVSNVIAAFSPLGVACEGALPNFRLVALDVPPDIDVATVKKLLLAGYEDGRWDYDEGCIDDRWRSM